MASLPAARAQVAPHSSHARSIPISLWGTHTCRQSSWWATHTRAPTLTGTHTQCVCPSPPLQRTHLQAVQLVSYLVAVLPEGRQEAEHLVVQVECPFGCLRGEGGSAVVRVAPS